MLLSDETKGGREMTERSLSMISLISLIVILFAGLFILATWTLCLELPVIVVRVLGFALLISIPVFVFANVKQVTKA